MAYSVTIFPDEERSVYGEFKGGKDAQLNMLVPQSLSGNISLDCIVFGASVGLRRGARRRARCG